MSSIETNLLNDDRDFEQLLSLAAERSQESREAVFRTIADLLLEPDGLGSDRSRSLASEILRRLLSEIESKLRWELATRLADRDDVPRELVNSLAMDEVEIARPVLLRSPLLTDFDLIEIIHNKAQAHQLAIARRESLSKDVSQALLDSDDADVIRTLIGNAGAKLTTEMLEFLVEESKWQHAYQEPLVHREDLPDALARKLYWWVAAPVREYICEHFSVDPELIDDVIESAVDQELQALVQKKKYPNKTQSLVQKLYDQNELSINFLVSALYHGETELFEEGLVMLTGLRARLVRRLIHDAAGEGLAIACRALNVDTETYGTIYALTRHDGYRSQTTKPEVEQKLRTEYEAIRPQTARRILRQWQRDRDYLMALRAICGQDETGRGTDRR